MNKFVVVLLLVFLVAASAVLLKSRLTISDAPVDRILDDSVQESEPTYEELVGEEVTYLEEQSPEDTLLGDEN